MSILPADKRTGRITVEFQKPCDLVVYCGFRNVLVISLSIQKRLSSTYFLVTVMMAEKELEQG
ncbi:hypothetical protein [Lentilactobacillus hilgardii]|uniref:hypothetical protein n=1 Tax=Lentilactobacillus hilgardii TaxID=1588 RepID=UPI0021A7F337|nr:hypothetical protein [Lentilactobacillus hilgardii]